MYSQQPEHAAFATKIAAWLPHHMLLWENDITSIIGNHCHLSVYLTNRSIYMQLLLKALNKFQLT